MRRDLIAIVCLLGTAIIAGTDIALARPYESFTLGTHDKIVAETPGCFANCAVTGTTRTCTVKSFDCRAVCMELAECRPDGLNAMKVCAVVRERP